MGDTRPALVTVPNVEVLSVGTWNASTGPFTVTADDLSAAVGAWQDPGYTTPKLKIGHVDPRFDGEPAIGRLINPRLSDDGMTLVVDIAGVPTWIADVMGTAWPGRSIEANFRHRTQTGTTHRFALTGLALLGVEAPAVSTLADVACLYGLDPTSVAAAAATSLTEEETMPQPVQVAASVNLDTVRQQYYAPESAALRVKVGDSNWSWVREVYSDFIVVDDDEGHLFQVPWSEDPAQPGQVVWGEPVAVRVEYAPQTVAASDAGDGEIDALRAGALRVRLSTMTPDPPTDERPAVRDGAAAVRPLGQVTHAAADSDAADGHAGAPSNEPDTTGGAAPAPAAEPATTDPGAEPDPHPSNEEDDMSTDLSGLRSALGLADDADLDAVTTAVTELKTKAEQPVPASEPVAAAAPTLPEGVTTIDEQTLADLKVSAAAGRDAMERFRREDRDRHIAAAVEAGKIPPARAEHWTRSWDADPDGTKATLDSLEAGLVVPVAAKGSSNAPDVNLDDAQFAEFDAMFTRPAANKES